MRTKIAALALTMAVTNVHAGDSAGKYLFAGMLSGIIIAASMDAKRQQDEQWEQKMRRWYPERYPKQPAPAPIVYMPPPPPAPVVTARSKYLEACQAYGFSAGYCVSNWDGKTLQASGS